MERWQLDASSTRARKAAQSCATLPHASALPAPPAHVLNSFVRAPVLVRELAIGHKSWVIAEGYIPRSSHGEGPAFESHETACMLNAGSQPAQVELTMFFRDRDPVGPYHVIVPGRRTLHLRFNELSDPEPVPRGTDYACVIQSNQPIVVQHTRLDSRQAELALMTTLAYPAG